MKRIVLALAIVAMLAVPAMAQDVSVDVDGLIIGSYASIDDWGVEDFNSFSWLDWDYSNVAVTLAAGDNVAFTYRAGLDDFVNAPVYTREAYISLNNLAPAVSSVKVGEFTFPFAAEEWFGYLKGGASSYISATASGVELAGSFAPIDYRLAVTNSQDSNGYWAFTNNDDKPIWAKVSTDLGPVNAGLSYVKQGDSNALGVNAAFDAGIVGVKAEYITANDLWGFDNNFIFAGVTVPVTGPLSVFAKYYNVSGDYSGNALAFGADYALSENATIRVEHLSDDDQIWAATGTEAQLRISF